MTALWVLASALVLISVGRLLYLYGERDAYWRGFADGEKAGLWQAERSAVDSLYKPRHYQTKAPESITADSLSNEPNIACADCITLGERTYLCRDHRPPLELLQPGHPDYDPDDPRAECGCELGLRCPAHAIPDGRYIEAFRAGEAYAESRAAREKLAKAWDARVAAAAEQERKFMHGRLHRTSPNDPW